MSYDRVKKQIVADLTTGFTDNGLPPATQDHIDNLFGIYSNEIINIANQIQATDEDDAIRELLYNEEWYVHLLP
jgi:hypothetical protein